MFNYVYEKRKVIGVAVLVATVLGLLTELVFPALAFSAQKDKNVIEAISPQVVTGLYTWIM
jgi:hypothetical protein